MPPSSKTGYTSVSVGAKATKVNPSTGSVHSCSFIDPWLTVKLVLTQIGMIICPIGMFILGWTADAQTHWIGPQIGTTILLLGLTLAFNSIQNLWVPLHTRRGVALTHRSIVDAFMPYSAAGTAAATAVSITSSRRYMRRPDVQLRSVLACILPIFAPDMFSALGWGWGCTLLALVALIAVPAPVVVRRPVKLALIMS